MSRKLGAGDVNSWVSGADVVELEEGMSGGMVGGSESKTLAGNPGDAVGLSDGVGVPDESKVRVPDESKVRVPDESKVRVEGSVNGSGSVGIWNLPGASKRRTAELMSKEWETWAVMDMVERVLGGKLGMDNEVEDVDTVQNDRNVNMASDRDAWQGMVGGPTSICDIDINKTVIDGDSGNLNSGYQGVGDHLNVSQDSVSNEVVPYGKMEIEELNDHKADVLIPKERRECMTEEEGDFFVSDLVWAKVRSHPWWPGQIVEPSAASNKGKRHFKKSSYLIAYFGDQTFAWNEGSKIKHFRKHFPQMGKQSNADGFFYAVDCALDEVARRVELGLSCRCVPQDVYATLSSQEVANAGLREESRRRVGGDSLSGVNFFSPEDIVQSLESLAQSPCKIDKLQFVVTKAQLLAFNRLHGQYQFPVFEDCGRFLEDGSQFLLEGETKGSVEVVKGLLYGPGLKSTSNVPSKKRKATARGSFSRKRKHLSVDNENPKIKQKYLSVLMSASNSSIQKDVKEGIIPSEILTPDGILSELTFAARKPLWVRETMKPILCILCKLRNFVCLEKSTRGKSAQDSGKLKGKQPANLESADTFGCEGTEDSYWTDRIVQSYSEDLALLAPENPKETAAGLEASTGAILNLDNDKEKETIMVDLDPEDPPVPVNEASEEYFPTALILNFTTLESVPSIVNLNEIFRRYGPLEESETKILTKSKRAKVIFKRQQDAETAFSSTGKYSIFGPSLLSYRLNYVPMPRKSRATSKRSKKGTSSEINAV